MNSDIIQCLLSSSGLLSGIFKCINLPDVCSIVSHADSDVLFAASEARSPNR